MSATKDILILRGGGLGDTLLAIPAVRALRRRLLPRRIDWAGNPTFLPVIPLGVRIDGLLSADAAPFALLRRADAEPEAVLGAFSRDAPYDLLVAWTTGDAAFERNLRALAETVLRADPHPPGGKPPFHAADYLLRCLGPLGVGKTGEAGVPRIRPTPENLRRAGALLNGLGIGADRPYFILHPGSGGRWKRWPISLFARLGERLAGEGEVVWVAGPAEEGVLEEVRAQSRGRDVKAVESPPLPDLAALLSEARGYVGCDSGVTHLAAACGAPTVALFGPTDPAVWGPRGERVVTLRRNAGCESCKQGEKSGHTCLAEIAVEEVLEAVLGFGPPGGP